MKNLAVLDLETSGVNPNKHSVLEIGIIPLDKKPAFHIYIKSDNISWSEFALENFKKFSSRWDAEAVPPAEAVKALSNYLLDNFNGEKVTLIGHNIGFDVSFLKKLAFDAGLDEIPYISHRVIDTHTLLYILSSQGLVPESALSSDGAFKHFNIEPNEESRHTAIGDAIATKKLFKSVLNLLTKKGEDTN